MTINNQRPGVYSQYDVSSLSATARSLRYAAVVAKATGGESTAVHTFLSFQKAAETFPQDQRMLGAIEILFDCGVSRVVAAPVTGGDYASALAAVESLENIGAVLCDSEAPEQLAALKASVHAASDALRERVGFCGIDDADAALGSERVVLCCPAGLPKSGRGEACAFFTAAAVAGTVLALGDPAHNFSGASLGCIQPPRRMSESQVQSLLAGGVTVVEPLGEGVQIVRALTTRAKVNGVPEHTLRGLNTILIIDDVMGAVRDSLTRRLRGRRISTRSTDSVLAQVTVELAAKQDDGVIESFSAPLVYPRESDPEICVVELAFKVAHVVSQIHVVAHIQV